MCAKETAKTGQRPVFCFFTSVTTPTTPPHPSGNGSQRILFFGSLRLLHQGPLLLIWHDAGTSSPTHSSPGTLAQSARPTTQVNSLPSRRRSSPYLPTGQAGLRPLRFTVRRQHGRRQVEATQEQSASLARPTPVDASAFTPARPPLDVARLRSQQPPMERSS